MRSWPVLVSLLLPGGPHPLPPRTSICGMQSSMISSPSSRLLLKNSGCRTVLHLVVQSAVPLRPPLHPSQAWAKDFTWSFGYRNHFENICSTLYCIIFQNLLKKTFLAHEVWAVCLENPVVNNNDKINEFTNGFAKQTPTRVTLLAWRGTFQLVWKNSQNYSYLK